MKFKNLNAVHELKLKQKIIDYRSYYYDKGIFSTRK